MVVLFCFVLFFPFPDVEYVVLVGPCEAPKVCFVVVVVCCGVVVL